MNVDSVASLGLIGIQKGMQGARSAAADIASAEQSAATSPTDVAASLLALKVAEQQVAVSAKVVASANETIGSLIDVLA